MTAFTPTVHPWNQELWQQLTIELDRANHALLFIGDQGLGKRALAFSFAHYLMCDNHSQSETLFMAGSHPDFHVLMPEHLIQDDLQGSYANRYIETHSGKPKKGITIDQVRKLTKQLTTYPHISKTRIILIDGADTMNNSAANGLLKNLEEPPGNTLFVLVTDEVSKLPKTVRSRCSLVNFRAPETESARAWLEMQKVLPDDQVDAHLAMANNHPLRALQLYQDGYIESLKAVFTDVNNLWSNRTDSVQVAKHWQSLGALSSVEILQKLTTDLLRSSLSDKPKVVFFPVQQSWIKSVSSKLSQQKLLAVVDDLNYAKKMLSTTVDELLVLETISNKLRQLPV